MIIFCDIDGTIADIEHRIHHVRGGNSDWDKFFDSCYSDKPITPVVNTIINHIVAGDTVLFVSGRSDQVLAKTKTWISRHIIEKSAEKISEILSKLKVDELNAEIFCNEIFNSWNNPRFGNFFTETDPMYIETFLQVTGPLPFKMPTLWMRPKGDYSADDVLKKRMLDKIMQYTSGAKPDLVYDDRQRVVNMWRSEDIRVAQVAAGDFDPLVKPNPKFFGPKSKGNIPLLTIMVGPSGAGKTTWLKNVASENFIISTDLMRKIYAGDMTNQERNRDVFIAQEELTRTRLRLALPTFIDSTSLLTEARKKLVGISHDVLGNDYPVRYVIVNRPMDQKIRDGGWRNNVIVKDGKSLMEYHQNIFSSQLPNILKGDGFPNVVVQDERINFKT